MLTISMALLMCFQGFNVDIINTIPILALCDIVISICFLSVIYDKKEGGK